MKYLDIPRLSLLASYISGRELGDTILSANIETFSCKAAGEDKKLGKQLERQYKEELRGEEATPGSPATPKPTPLGDLSSPSTRRLLINLIATLNASFPDYDFRSTKPEEFLRVMDYRLAVQKVNKHLAEIIQTDGTPLVDNLWGAIHDAVTLSECEVYTYIPNLDSDPFSEDALWSFNFFFVNVKDKKILYFTCLARSKAHAGIPASDVDSDDGSGDDEPASETGILPSSQPFDTPVPLVPVTSPKVTSVSVPTPSAASGPGITGRRMSIIMLEEGGDDGEDEDGEASNGEEDDD